MHIRRRILFNIYTNNNSTYAIYYTSSDGNVIVPYSTNVFGANIISNTYVDGQGIINFDGPIKTIGNSAFYNCKSLTSITIPDSVTKIGNNAFCYCYSLTSVNIPDSVTEIGSSAFDHCTSLTSVTIGDSVTTIGYAAFYYCTSLTSVTIPDSVTEIGNNAFYSCVKLTSVNIPDSVTTIGKYAFRNCTNLTSVTIGDSVTTIVNGAFYNCTSLTSVYCKATTPPSLGGDMVFDKNHSDRKIYVPMESVDAYKSAEGWSQYYASAIVGYDFEESEESGGNFITFQ